MSDHLSSHTRSDLERATRDLLESVGYKASDAEILADHLIKSECRGYKSHGLWRLFSMTKNVPDPTAEWSIEKSLPGFVFVDAKGSHGIVALTEAIRQVKRGVKDVGAITLGVTNFVDTTGCLGVYASELCADDIISISFGHTESVVAPFGTTEPILGTNPICIGVPYQDYSFVADMATSARSYGAVRVAANNGESIPTGVVQTKRGQPLTEPGDTETGTLLPMAGYKGYALGLAIELLCGPFLGGKAGRAAVSGSEGFLSILLDAAAVRSVSDVKKEMSLLFNEITAAPLLKEFPSIRIPGERAARGDSSSELLTISPDLRQLLRL